MISIVIPVLNEAENLKRLIPSICEVMEKSDFEIVIVDGKSTDDTADVAFGLIEKFNVDLYGGREVIRFFEQRKIGFANSLVEGIQACSTGRNVKINREIYGDIDDYIDKDIDKDIEDAIENIIVTMDAENHLPSQVPHLVNTLSEAKADAVVGSRFFKESDVGLDRTRFLSTRLCNRIAAYFLKLNVRDCSSGFRAYRACAVKSATGNIKTKYFSVQVEILYNISQDGGKIVEVPIRYLKRVDGKSKFRARLAIEDGLKLMGIACKQKIYR